MCISIYNYCVYVFKYKQTKDSLFQNQLRNRPTVRTFVAPFPRNEALAYQKIVSHGSATLDGFTTNCQCDAHLIEFPDLV